MRTLLGVLAASVLLCATGHTQVINGEGDYEGSSLHTPPPQAEADAGTDDRKKAHGPETPTKTAPAETPAAR